LFSGLSPRPYHGVGGETPKRIERYNKVTFDPVTTSALRIEATLQPGFSAGILEWTVR